MSTCVIAPSRELCEEGKVRVQPKAEEEERMMNVPTAVAGWGETQQRDEVGQRSGLGAQG